MALSNPTGLDSSTGRAADRYPESTNSSLGRVNVFQLTSAVSDYHDKISLHESLRMILKFGWLYLPDILKFEETFT